MPSELTTEPTYPFPLKPWNPNTKPHEKTSPPEADVDDTYSRTCCNGNAAAPPCPHQNNKSAQLKHSTSSKPPMNSTHCHRSTTNTQTSPLNPIPNFNPPATTKPASGELESASTAPGHAPSPSTDVSSAVTRRKRTYKTM